MTCSRARGSLPAMTVLPPDTDPAKTPDLLPSGGVVPGATTNADPAARRRIVLVAPPYFDIPPKGYGGVEVVVADLADALVKRGHDVTVLGAGEPRTSARLIPVWESTLADRLGEPYPEIMHALKVRRVIERIAHNQS